MTVKHRLTKEEKTISYIDWRNERRQHDYDVIDSGDLVYLYEQLPEGDTIQYLFPYDRGKADNMVAHQPGIDGYVEITDVPLFLRLRIVIEELRRQKDGHGYLEDIMTRVGLQNDLERIDHYVNEINLLNLATIARSKEGTWMRAKANNSLQYMRKDDTQITGYALKEKNPLEEEVEKEVPREEQQTEKVKTVTQPRRSIPGWNEGPNRFLQALGIMIALSALSLSVYGLFFYNR